ncbi:MAG: glutamate--cysteine ligase [Thiohalomonadaceae bacterium]
MHTSSSQTRLNRFLDAGHAPLLGDFLCGVEKESLRVNTEGSIAQTPHPRGLGSALTHPWITTDFSEALLELITPPLASMEDVLGFLRELHRFVYAHLGDEYLWATSMPCVVTGEEGIPIARYGSSNAGRMKHIYRVGLSHRYGRMMQAISGVHFNFSLSDRFWEALQALEEDPLPRQDFVSDNYFRLIRNLQRIGWLVPYLFGASPAVCKSFLQGQPGSLAAFDAGTYFSPYATSLRMGDIGYQNNRGHEIGVRASYDNLDEYVKSLTHAINTPYPGYERIGVKVNGEYRQLNANILQIENEYYTTVRPKQIVQNGEKPTLALKRRGVRYIELRSLDVNAYEPLGIGLDQMRFLHLLMLWCLFEDSPRIRPWEQSEIDNNEMLAAHRGREPGLVIVRNGEPVTLQQWARAICDALEPIAAALDVGKPDAPYARTLAMQRNAVEDPECTPSARMLREMRDNGESFHAFAKRMSFQHRAWFRAQAPDVELERRLEELTVKSLAEQREKEEADTLSFDEYLERYFAQSL